MYNGHKVIDVHGHISTPPEFRAYAYGLISTRRPSEVGDLKISDEPMETAVRPHLKMMDERNIDIQMISPRPIAMMHWERPFIVEKWTRTTNDVIYQQCKAYPDRFVGIAQLPQHSTLNTKNCIEELERCVKALGFVGAIVNPDPGGDKQTPGMNEEYWFPLYEKAQELKIPLIVHPSFGRDPRFEAVPYNTHYNFMIEETLATLILENSNVFQIFPNLRVIVCHCGGAPSRFVTHRAISGQQGGGSVGMPVMRRARRPEKDVSNNVFFDICAYDKDFIITAIKQKGVDRMLFGTEAPGAGTATLNPETGKPSDDLVPVIDSIDFLTVDDKLKIFNGNAKRVFSSLKLD